MVENIFIRSLTERNPDTEFVLHSHNNTAKMKLRLKNNQKIRVETGKIGKKQEIGVSKPPGKGIYHVSSSAQLKLVSSNSCPHSPQFMSQQNALSSKIYSLSTLTFLLKSCFRSTPRKRDLFRSKGVLISLVCLPTGMSKPTWGNYQSTQPTRLSTVSLSPPSKGGVTNPTPIYEEYCTDVWQVAQKYVFDHPNISYHFRKTHYFRGFPASSHIFCPLYFSFPSTGIINL